MNESKLRVIIEAVTDKFDGAMDKVQGALDGVKEKSGDFGDKLEGVSNKLGGAAKKMAPVSIAAGAIGGALVATAKKTADYTDNVDKMSQKLGISRKAYQEWDYVLSQNGASIDSMKMGMKTLNKQLDELAQTGDTTGTAFGRLGLSYDDLAGKSQEEVFETVITSLQGVQDETERTALANQLLGRSGMELAPLLNSGAEATDALKKRAQELGLVLDDDVIDAGVNMTDAMDTMKRALSTVGIAIASAVMPLITKFAYFIAENVPKVTKRVREIADAFNNLPGPIQNLVSIILAVLTAAAPVLKIASMITGKMGALFKLASKGQGLLGKVLSLPPQALIIVAVIAAIIAAFVYLMKTNEEFRAKMTEIWGQIKEAMVPVVEALKAAWEGMKPAIDALIQTIASLLEVIMPVIATILSAVLGVVAKILPPITSVLTFVISTASKILQVIIQVIQNIINRVNTTVEIIKTVIAIVKGVFTVLGNAIVAVWTNIKNKASAIWDGIKSKIQTVVQAIKTIANSLPEPVKKVFTSIANHVSNVFNKIKNAWEGLKKFATGVASGVSKAFSSMVSKVKGIINKFIGAANAGIGVVNSLPGVSISKIPYLAHGTRNWAGGFAYMNEGGRGELTYLPNGAQVIPHDVSMKYAKEAAKSNSGDDARFFGAISGLANALITASQMNNAGTGGEYHFRIDLGGTRIAEQIYTLNKQGELILKGTR